MPVCANAKLNGSMLTSHALLKIGYLSASNQQCGRKYLIYEWFPLQAPVTVASKLVTVSIQSPGFNLGICKLAFLGFFCFLFNVLHITISLIKSNTSCLHRLYYAPLLQPLVDTGTLSFCFACFSFYSDVVPKPLFLLSFHSLIK